MAVSLQTNSPNGGALDLAAQIHWVRVYAQIFTRYKSIYLVDLFPYYMRHTNVMPKAEVTEAHHQVLISVAHVMKEAIRVSGAMIWEILCTRHSTEDVIVRTSFKNVLSSLNMEESVLALTLVAEYIQIPRRPVKKMAVDGDI